jgi:hypothetical protein
LNERATLLTAGDLAAFVLFGVIGLASHEESITLTVVARSLLPFPLAWFALAPWLGMTGQAAQYGQLRLTTLVAVWAAVGVVALAGRALVFERELFNAFFVIALAGNGLFLAGWRSIYSRWLAPADTLPVRRQAGRQARKEA